MTEGTLLPSEEKSLEMSAVVVFCFYLGATISGYAVGTPKFSLKHQYATGFVVLSTALLVQTCVVQPCALRLHRLKPSSFSWRV